MDGVSEIRSRILSVGGEWTNGCDLICRELRHRGAWRKAFAAVPTALARVAT